jgi:hypothetical protein
VSYIGALCHVYVLTILRHAKAEGVGQSLVRLEEKRKQENAFSIMDSKWAWFICAQNHTRFHSQNQSIHCIPLHDTSSMELASEIASWVWQPEDVHFIPVCWQKLESDLELKGIFDHPAESSIATENGKIHPVLFQRMHHLYSYFLTGISKRISPYVATSLQMGILDVSVQLLSEGNDLEEDSGVKTL